MRSWRFTRVAHFAEHVSLLHAVPCLYPYGSLSHMPEVAVLAVPMVQCDVVASYCLVRFWQLCKQLFLNAPWFRVVWNIIARVRDLAIGWRYDFAPPRVPIRVCGTLTSDELPVRPNSKKIVGEVLDATDTVRFVEIVAPTDPALSLHREYQFRFLLIT